MISDAVKVERERTKQAKIHAQSAMLKDLLGNPVLEILAGTLIVEAVHNAGIWNDKQREVGGQAVIGAVIVQQLAPTLPSLFMAGGQIFTAGMKALPAIAAGAGLAGVL